MNEDKWQTIHTGIAHSHTGHCDQKSTLTYYGCNGAASVRMRPHIRIRIYQRKSQLFPKAHSLISVSNPACTRTHTHANLFLSLVSSCFVSVTILMSPMLVFI